MICSSCLESWQDHNSTTPSCPFCRCEIKTFEPIIISPFEASKQKMSKRSSSLDPSELLSNKVVSLKSLITRLTNLLWITIKETKDIESVFNRLHSDDITRENVNGNDAGTYMIAFDKSPKSKLNDMPTTSTETSNNKSPSNGVKTTHDPDEPDDSNFLSLNHKI